MRLRDTLLWYPFAILCGLFCCIYPIALIGIVFSVNPPFSLKWAPGALLFLEGSILLLAAMLVYGWRRALGAGLLIFLLSYGVEALGVKTSFPFGTYYYTDALFPLLPGNVPLPVMFAWMLVIFGVYGWCRRLLARTTPEGGITITVALFGASLATLLDLEIEPVAAHVQHYWRWLHPGPFSYDGIPLINFIAWYTVAFILLLLMQIVLGPMRKAPGMHTSRLALLAPRVLFITSLCMFGLVDLTHGYPGAAAPGILAFLFLWRIDRAYAH